MYCLCLNFCKFICQISMYLLQTPLNFFFILCCCLISIADVSLNLTLNLLKLHYKIIDNKYILPLLHVLFVSRIRLCYKIHGNGVSFQQIEFKVSPKSTVIGTPSIKIAHHNSKFLLFALHSPLTLLNFPLCKTVGSHTTWSKVRVGDGGHFSK